MNDALSFYKRGKGYLGIKISAVLRKDKEYHIYESCPEILSRVAVVPHSKVEVTQEFRHAYHSYVGGVLFHQDMKLKLLPNNKEDEAIFVLISKGSWFNLGK